MNATFQEARKQPTETSFSPSARASVPPIVHEVLRLSGQLLDPATRSYMEPRFGHNLGRVRVQAKLTIGASGDALEQEADRVADHVLATVPHYAVKGNSQAIQRYSGQSTKQRQTALCQCRAGPCECGQAVRVRFAAGYGAALRLRFFQSAGAHWCGCVIRADISANAYALGRNIVFGAGRFAPETHEGRRLLAHELTHVVQQGAADCSYLDLPRDKQTCSARAIFITVTGISSKERRSSTSAAR